MSAPTDEGNPWLSLADLIRINTSVATLATAIETFGIQTYDRFGRRVPATDEGPEGKVSKTRALNLLATYYADLRNPDREEPFDNEGWFGYDSPLLEFGWPADEAPKFETYSGEVVPEAIARSQERMDVPVATRTRRTYLTIIASLCKRCSINLQDRGASQRIKEATETLGYPVDDGTIQSMLKEIPEALEARMK